MNKIIVVLGVFVAAVIGAAILYRFMPDRMTPENIRLAVNAEEKIVLASDEEGFEESEDMEMRPPVKQDPLPFSELASPPTTAEGGLPDVFHVMFECSAGNFVVAFHKDWAPEGAKRVFEMIRENVLTEARFFRVVSNFMVQFGLPGDPEVTQEWSRSIKDDPVVQSNQRGFVTFAMRGPNTRTTQMFINYGDNSRLDKDGFAPVGQVVAGMEAVDYINPQYSEKPLQSAIMEQGNEYLKKFFPRMDYIKRAYFVEPNPEAAAAQSAPADAAPSGSVPADPAQTDAAPGSGTSATDTVSEQATQ